ncbi:MAG: magnetochrome domain-containing protein [Rhodospirillaceae bacterium]
MKLELPARQDLAAWIMATGIVFGLAMFLTAVFNNNPWNDHTYAMASPIVAGIPSPHRDSRSKMVCSSCHIVVPAKPVAGPASWRLPIVQGTPAPHIDGREKQVCSNCHTILVKDKSAPVPKLRPVPSPKAPVARAPSVQAVTVALPTEPAGPPPAEILSPEAHEWFVSYRFQGKIVRVAGTGSRSVWGDVYVLVDDGINTPGWLDLAPRLFLQAGGCPVRPGMFVKGTAYRDPTADKTALGYAKSIMVNGELCTLRDTHLNGLWEEAGGADVEEP